MSTEHIGNASDQGCSRLKGCLTQIEGDFKGDLLPMRVALKSCHQLILLKSKDFNSADEESHWAPKCL